MYYYKNTNPKYWLLTGLIMYITKISPNHWWLKYLPLNRNGFYIRLLLSAKGVAPPSVSGPIFGENLAQKAVLPTSSSPTDTPQVSRVSGTLVFVRLDTVHSCGPYRDPNLILIQELCGSGSVPLKTKIHHSET